jgi:hypothetical protein
MMNRFLKYINKLNWKKILIILSGIFAGFVILLFVFRGPIVRNLIKAKVKSFNETYKADMQIGDFSFSGISGALIKDLTLKPIDGDTLLKIQSIYARVNIWKLLIFKVSLTDLELINANITLVKRDSINNYRFLLKNNKDYNEDIPVKDHDYGKEVNRLLDAVFYKIPSNIQIVNFSINANTDGYEISMMLPELFVKDHGFKSGIILKEKGKTNLMMLEGIIEPSEKIAKFKLYSADTSNVKIPFISYKWNWLFAFDTAQFSFEGNRMSDGKNIISGSSAVAGMLINHPRISTSDVFLNNASINYTFNIGKDYFELDSASVVVFNRLTFNPYACYRPHPSRQVTLKLHKQRFPAQDLFESLPQGLFFNLEGIKTKGDLAYNLDFFVDIDNPDSLQFESDLKRFDFRIESYGNTDLRKMNSDFLYTAYEKGEAVRSFIIGPENPDFRKLEDISPYLRNTVLISEDGGFFWHRGFLPESFKASITKNIKTKRFARGGSTISMQLVKNVFLNRNKTIARKVEEALIVWLIENNGLTSKNRMFEVYLNVIEWGPMIYGANEAARFYFNKDASRLTLAESLFLSSMIPHPKWFRYSFDEQGNLKPFLADYYSFASNRMLKKEMITQEDFDNLKPEIELKGPAKALIIKTDSIPADSLELELLRF